MFQQLQLQYYYYYSTNWETNTTNSENETEEELNITFRIVIEINTLFPLSQEDIAERPRVSTFISSMANYSNTIPAASEDADTKATPQSARMGTLIGVFLPCIQNIFGVILFIRLTWVVGTAGAVCAFLLVLGCCCVVRIQNYGAKNNTRAE